MEKRTELIKSGTQFLDTRGVGNALGEAETFLSYVLNCSRTELYLDNLTVEEKNWQHFWRLISARAKGFPLQYLVGSAEFMGLKLKLRPGVFIPRPETEILVETALSLLPTTYYLLPRVLDIGTGCGNIAISLAKFLKGVDIFACDISDTALQSAKENARLNGAEINLIKCDLFSAFKRKGCFSLIISNPPYISKEIIPQLPRELAYEPRRSLDGGRDGLFYYRTIINQAPDYLQDGGCLALELGDGQINAVKDILAQEARFSLLKVARDYNNVERVIVARKIGHR